MFIFLYIFLLFPSPGLLNKPGLANAIGLLSILSGMAIRTITIGLEYIERGGVNRKINASKLVTGGIYSLCRNPMYFGNLLLLFGFGIYANSSLFTLVIFPFFIFIYYSIIKAEEEFLTQKFGYEYTTYKQKVNQLIPSFRSKGSIFLNQKFNWRKVIWKEYNSLYLYFVGLLGIAVLQKNISLTVFIAGMFLITTLYLIIKIKKGQQRKTRIAAKHLEYKTQTDYIR
jgi:protein-S-isoprenylcysteine O-methyltransferase Ste14